MAKITGLIFTFDVASAQEVPFSILELSVPSFVCHSSLQTVKSADFGGGT